MEPGAVSWGNSWGSSWGNAWGLIGPPVIASLVYGAVRIVPMMKGAAWLKPLLDGDAGSRALIAGTVSAPMKGTTDDKRR